MTTGGFSIARLHRREGTGVPAPERHRIRRIAGLAAGAALLSATLTACSSSTSADSTSTSAAASTAAVTGNACPYAVDASTADFYPIQPSFSAGYTASGQKLNSTTASWAYVVTGDFPYSNWMAWYLYNTKGVPLYKFSDTDIKPASGSTNPTVDGNPVLATPRHYSITFMPATTPASVVSSMQAQGQNVALLPAVGSSPGVSIVSRSYWSFANDGLGNYDRFGYGGPTNTPFPTISAFLTNSSTGALTSTPVPNCGAQSQLPQKAWYNRQTQKPVVTFANTSPPGGSELADLPHFVFQTGAGSEGAGKEFPPSPVPDQVQFYRNVASTTPYADVDSAPPLGNPPDACGGYVMANLPNNVVSLVHVAQVPTFPDYSGATSSTLNNSSNDQVQFYSVVIYGAAKQLDALGTTHNSQIGNSQILKAPDGSTTVVLYPQSATSQQVSQIAAIAKANGWNLLKSGLQTGIAPNVLVVREKGQNKQWANALSANDVTQGAPCPQSTNSSLLLPQDPPTAAVTQSNGMGLTAPTGQNCSIAEFTAGTCLKNLETRMQQSGEQWSAQGGWPTQTNT